MGNVICMAQDQPDFLADISYDILTGEQWYDFAFMFEDSGYEVYDGRGREYLEEGIREEIGAPTRRNFALFSFQCQLLLSSRFPS
ncbi:hypothetical protein V1505DRAFT_360505 [Lipomyces doorenjongii]